MLEAKEGGVLAAVYALCQESRCGVQVEEKMCIRDRSNTTLFFFTTLLVLLSVYRHRANIDRLMQGTEPKLKH